ncbi:MAG: multi-sensor hybrid histidine kinase [Gemmatimonadetes bacterium]|nr:multi-sensor hybrid histidine kinase [Gemmatimonadota bacterium]
MTRTIAPTSLAASPPSVHPTVRLSFLLRVWTYPLFMLLYGTHVWRQAVPLWIVAVFVAHTVIFPHLARRISTRSRDSKRAEQRNLLFDSFLIGCYIPFTGFSLWPNGAALLGINAGNVSVAGPRFALRGLLSTIAGTVVVGLFTGFHTNLFSFSHLTQLMSIGVVGAYTTAFAYQSYLHARKVSRANAQIREQHALIEEKTRQLEERSLELEHALTEAEEANAAKSNFLATMSHELRTPLNSIIGFTNIVLRNKGGNMAKQDVVYLSRVSASGAHLLNLINGVLDLAKIEARETNVERVPVDLAVLTRETLSQLEPQAEERSVRLIGIVPPMAVIVADRARLQQIMINLVGNALKFTERGQVTLRVTSDPYTGKPMRMDVIDTGIGIREDRLKAIFEAFQQADTTTTRQYGGTGLGLSISRSLADLMGWQIEVSSKVGVGSTFSVIFTPRADDELSSARRRSSGTYRLSSDAINDRLEMPSASA